MQILQSYVTPTWVWLKLPLYLIFLATTLTMLFVQARPSHGDQSQDQSQTPGTRQRPLGAIKICCCRNLPAWTTHHRTFSHSHPIGPLWPITSHPHIAHLILKLSSANRTFSYRLCCILCRLSTLSTVT